MGPGVDSVLLLVNDTIWLLAPPPPPLCSKGKATDYEGFLLGGLLASDILINLFFLMKFIVVCCFWRNTTNTNSEICKP